MSDRNRDRDDEEDDLDHDGTEPPKRRGRLLAAMIALFAIGGFGGVLWYAYSQGQRPADAVAPILRSDGEPSRVRPEQPGGMVVPHQDKLVLNNMQQAARPGQAERLLPPAEAPLPQTARTAPPPAAQVALAPPPTPAPAPPPAPPAPPPAAAPTPAPTAAPTTAGTLIAPPAPPPVAPAPSAAAPAALPPALPPVMTPPPPAAPPQIAARPPAAATAPAAPPAPARTGTPGEWRVQLGSFPAADQASAQWDRLKKAHAELQALGLTTVRVDLGDKGVWYRVQAGPLNEAGARALCEDLKAKKRDCLVVRP
jgi:hypothetical protein